MLTNEKGAIYALLGLIFFSLLAALFGNNPGKWLTSAGLMMDVLGLTLLHVSGVLAVIYNEVKRLNERGDSLLSRYVRELIASPDESEYARNLRQRLFMEPSTGVQMIVLGCLTQLIGVWL